MGIAARSSSKRVFADLEAEGLAPAGLLLAAFDERTNAATQKLLGMLTPMPEALDTVRRDLQRALDDAETWWQLAEAGEDPQDTHLQGNDADDDEAAEELKSLHASSRIQSRIMKHFDRMRLHAPRSGLEEVGQIEDTLRLDDLQDSANQEHTWWQALNPQEDRVLPHTEWVTANRLRLGTPIGVVDRICGCCGSKLIDRPGYHSLCCSTSESTMGHNRVRDCVGPTGRDAGEQYGKICTALFGDLQTQGIVFEPMIFSAYGRRHRRATQLIHTAAQRAARHRGWSSAAGLRRWWLRQLAAEVWRRAARMVYACSWTSGSKPWLRGPDPIEEATHDTSAATGGSAALGMCWAPV